MMTPRERPPTAEPVAWQVIDGGVPLPGMTFTTEDHARRASYMMPGTIMRPLYAAPPALGSPTADEGAVMDDEPEALIRLIQRNLDLNDHPDSMQGDDDGPSLCPGCLTLAQAILKAGYRRASLSGSAEKRP